MNADSCSFWPQFALKWQGAHRHYAARGALLGRGFWSGIPMMRYSWGTALSAAAALMMLAACTTKPQAAAETPPPGPSSSSSSVQSSIIPGSAEDLRVNVGDTVHFDYDKSDVRDDDRNTLQHQAAWLQKYPQVRVTIEGHCDERGTREYNIALG